MKRNPAKTGVQEKACQALDEAVAGVVEIHRREGRKLAVWRDGKVAWISPEEARELREEPAPYRVPPRQPDPAP